MYKPLINKSSIYVVHRFSGLCSKIKILNCKDPSRKTYFHQWLAAIGGIVIMLELGIYIAWSSPYLARLTATDSPLPLTPSEASWVASLYNPGRIVGAILGVMCVNYFGSRRMTTYAVVPICGCWILTMYANNPIWLYYGRFFGGVGFGMVGMCLPLYTAEFALPAIRGAIASAATIGGVAFGTVLSSYFGTYMSLYLSSAIFLIPCIPVIILYAWLPETPLWLVKINDYEAAKRSIMWYQPISDPEFELRVARKLACSTTLHEKIQTCIKPGPIRRAIIIILVLYALAALSGMCNIGFYMETILIRSKLTIIKPSDLVIYVHYSCTVVSFLPTCMIDKFGRKWLLSISSLGLAIWQLSLGVNSYLVNENVDTSHLQWLPIISLFMLTDFYVIGVSSIPSTILAEMFPPDVSHLVTCVANLTGFAFSFLANKSYQPMVDLVGEHYVLWIQSIFAFLIVPFTYFFLPETKTKSLQQIQKEMMYC